MALNLRRSRQSFLDSPALKVVKSYIMSSRFFKSGHLKECGDQLVAYSDLAFGIADLFPSPRLDFLLFFIASPPFAEPA